MGRVGGVRNRMEVRVRRLTKPDPKRSSRRGWKAIWNTIIRNILDQVMTWRSSKVLDRGGVLSWIVR